MTQEKIKHRIQSNISVLQLQCDRKEWSIPRNPIDAGVGESVYWISYPPRPYIVTAADVASDNLFDSSHRNPSYCPKSLLQIISIIGFSNI